MILMWRDIKNDMANRLGMLNNSQYWSPFADHPNPFFSDFMLAKKLKKNQFIGLIHDFESKYRYTLFDQLSFLYEIKLLTFWFKLISCDLGGTSLLLWAYSLLNKLRSKYWNLRKAPWASRKSISLGSNGTGCKFATLTAFVTWGKWFRLSEPPNVACSIKWNNILKP